MSGDTVTAKFHLDLRDFERSLQESGEQVRNFEGRMRQAWQNSTAGVDLLFRAVGSVVDAIKGWVSEAAEAEQAEMRLSRALQQRNQYTQEGVNRLSEFNTAIQRQTGVSGDALTAIQAQLVAMGVYREDLERATLAAIGFSESHGVELNSAVNVVGKAILGNTESLRRYNVFVKDGDQAIRELARGYQFAVDRGNTLDGALRKQEEALGDLDEALGRVFSKSSAWENFTDKATHDLDRLTGWIDRNQSKITGFIDTVWMGFGRALNALSGDILAGPDVIVEQLPLPQEDGALATPNARAQERQSKYDSRAMAAEDRERERRRRAAIDAEQAAIREERQIIEQMNREKEMANREAEREAERSAKEQERIAKEKTDSIAAENERYLEMALAFMEREKKIQTDADDVAGRQAANKLLLLKRVGEQFSLGIANTVIAGTAALARGGADLGEVVRGAMGSVLISMGSTLTQAGIFAGIAALLGLIPVLKPIFGEPALSGSVAAAATAAGIAMVAAGAAMGGGGGDSSGSARSGGRAGSLAGVGSSRASEATRRRADEDARLERYLDQRNSGADTRPDGFRQGTGATQITYEVHFPRNTLVIGSDREVGREVLRLAEEAKSLRGTPRGFG